MVDDRDEAYRDLLETLRWATEIEFTPAQKDALAPFCYQLAGINPLNAAIPSWRLKDEAERRRKAEARVAELETALRAQREEWVFRRNQRRNLVGVSRTLGRGNRESDTRANASRPKGSTFGE